MESTQAPKRKLTALYVLLIYMAAQLSSFILIAIPPLLDKIVEWIDKPTEKETLEVLNGYWSTGQFIVALVLIMLVISRDKTFWRIYPESPYSAGKIIGWGVLGFFMIYIGQIIGVAFEIAIGIDPGSQNTADIGAMMRATPIMIIAVAIIGPILEELVFRRVIFGTLIQKYNFWISALASGIVFAAIHLEFEHILLYTICGFIFAYLYHKTKSIWTSIIAHILLNSFVTIIQLNNEKIEQWLEDAQKMAMIFF